MSLSDCKFNSAKFQDVYDHLQRCSSIFIPPLESYIDIEVYSKKIIDNAETFEFWDDTSLVGLIAVYLNDNERAVAHITNVSVEKQFQGKGLSKAMLIAVLSRAVFLGFKEVTLQVNMQNTIAIGLYESNGFLKINVENNMVNMKNRLK